MYPKEIPDFIEQVMEQIEIGIDRVTQKEGDLVKVRYPEHIEMMLQVDAKIDDGTEIGDYESQSVCVKVPWPQRSG